MSPDLDFGSGPLKERLHGAVLNERLAQGAQSRFRAVSDRRPIEVEVDAVQYQQATFS